MWRRFILCLIGRRKCVMDGEDILENIYKFLKVGQLAREEKLCTVMINDKEI